MRHVRPLRRKRRSFELISIFFQSVYSLRPLFGHVRLNFSAHVSQSYLFFFEIRPLFIHKENS